MATGTILGTEDELPEGTTTAPRVGTVATGATLEDAAEDAGATLTAEFEDTGTAGWDAEEMALTEAASEWDEATPALPPVLAEAADGAVLERPLATLCARDGAADGVEDEDAAWAATGGSCRARRASNTVNFMFMPMEKGGCLTEQ